MPSVVRLPPSILGVLLLLLQLLQLQACAQSAAEPDAWPTTQNSPATVPERRATADSAPRARARPAKDDAVPMEPGRPDEPPTSASPAGTPSDTPPSPTGPCAEQCDDDLTPSARDCRSVITVGRRAALDDDFFYTGDTRGAYNAQDLEDFPDLVCADGGEDNVFRIYLYRGETVELSLSAAAYDPVLKLVTGPSCDDVRYAACVDDGLAGVSESMQVSADYDGWHYIVADGPFDVGARDGAGRYTLGVRIVATGAAGRCACR